ncbi:MAG TPA: S8 family serine peptidase [Nocardioidaceae bacterium]|nr:S8 family serine peptidase [Nocardioidaceae bacterium]
MMDPGTSRAQDRADAGFEPELSRAQTTGRYVITFAEEGADGDPAALLQSVAGLSQIASSRDFDAQAMDMAQTEGADATVFSELAMAVVSVDPDQLGALQTSTDAQRAVVAVAPELIHHIMPGSAGSSPDYVRGYRDGVGDLSGRFLGSTGAVAAAAPTIPAHFEDDDRATWGLHATQVLSSARSGQGVKVAVLDTGMDSTHPDFVGRSVTVQSFIAGESAQDGHGHGTHCIGTSCGPKTPEGTRRYGIAYEAEIFAGKVLSNAGSGADAGILAGINWAVANDCAIISMSLGADVPQPHPPYTHAGRRALRRGTLIIAAAGNNANRPADPGFVGAPANSHSIVAVGAVDSDLDIAPFSARSLPGRGGQVDIAGPGVAVFSSWPMPMKNRTISGTSMATPHVAGIAALWSEATGYRGLQLWATLARESERLLLPSVDVGSGLALAAP